MRDDQSEPVMRMAMEQDSLEGRIEAQARETALGLIQSYFGPDQKVTNMRSFYYALVHALKAAREGALGRI